MTGFMTDPRGLEAAMTLQRWISPLLCCVLVLGVGRQASAQIVDFTEVPDWPNPARSAAGTPAAWNFGSLAPVPLSKARLASVPPAIPP